MVNLQYLVIKSFMNELESKYRMNYGMMEPEFGNILAWAGNLALENLANCDALYHDMEHTIMVTLAGQEIIRGKHLIEGGVTPHDWLHFIMALLCHDIGYVKGICSNDCNGKFSSGINNETIELPEGSSSASLAPYHVDRGKQFIRERFEGRKNINPEFICELIEMTRFPVPDDENYKDTKDLPGLVRAADFIGQLGDLNHLRKMPALFYEFEETGSNEKFGYKNPGDIRKKYAKFFGEVVSPYINDALRYLSITLEGKQWISNLHAHAYASEKFQ